MVRFFRHGFCLLLLCAMALLIGAAQAKPPMPGEIIYEFTEKAVHPADFVLPADGDALPPEAVRRLRFGRFMYDAQTDTKGEPLPLQKGLQPVIAGAGSVENLSRYALYGIAATLRVLDIDNEPLYECPLFIRFRHAPDGPDHNINVEASHAQIMPSLQKVAVDALDANALVSPLEPDGQQRAATRLLIPTEAFRKSYSLVLVVRGAWGVARAYPGDPHAAILAAVKHDDLLTLQHLLTVDPTLLSTHGEFNYDLLQTAAHASAPRCVTELMKRGMYPDAPTADGATSVEIAAGSYYGGETLQAILLHGVNIDHQDNQGHTALHWACKSSSHDCVLLLLQYGANANLRDKAGKLPFDYASVVFASYNFAPDLFSAFAMGRQVHMQGMQQVMDGTYFPSANLSGFKGTIESADLDKGQITIKASEVSDDKGNKTAIKPPRRKVVEFYPQANFLQAAPKTAVRVASPNALLVGTTVFCLGYDQGVGKQLWAAMVSTIAEPGVNLAPPITDPTGWHINSYNDKIAMREATEGDALKVVVDNADGVAWHILLMPSKPMNLMNGVPYKITFKARSDAPHPYTMQCQIDQPDWHDTVTPRHPFTTTDEWQTFSFTVTMHDALDGHTIAPLFYLSEQSGTFYLKDVQISAVEVKE